VKSKVKDDMGNNTADSIHSKLLGIWASENIPFWQFKGDSIYYLDRDSVYPYYLHGDTLLVRYTGDDTLTDFGNVSIIDDTFYLKQYYRNNFVIKSYRYKK
jgi:hypothetical protein